jgi:hypothetical protein
MQKLPARIDDLLTCHGRARECQRSVKTSQG